MLDALNARTRLLLRRRSLYRKTFETDHGRLVLRDLCHFAGLARHMHVPGDPCSTSFNDGMRRVALRITSILGMNDAEIMKIAKEKVSYGEDDEDD